MFASTHASVGQNQGWMLFAPRERFVSNCRMQNAICKMQNDDRQSFPFPPSPLRAGISLVEVLIAMGILTIGLLGVAALFPVGAFYMQKGDVADRGSAVAQAAFNELLSRGVLDPEKWLMWEEDGVSTPGAPAVPTTLATMNTFLRPFAAKLRQQLASISVNTGATPAAKQWHTATEFGSAIVIDPIAIGGLIDPSTTAYNLGGKFPGSSFALDGNAPAYYTSPTSPWKPWVMSGFRPLAWTIHRVTIAQAPLTPMNAVLADRLFSSNDDLAMDLPAARDKPSIQRLDISSVDLNGNGTSTDDPLTRQSRGDYSWIVTVSPTTAEARNALALDPSRASYEVSVAVFYKRIVGRNVPKDDADFTANLELLSRTERIVNARVVSTGLNGGELLLTAVEPTNDNPFDNLKTGNWIMLCGPHPNSTQERPMFVARWYRVMSIEGKNSRLDDQGIPTSDTTQPERRLISVRGPQWPWQPESNGDLTNDYYLGNLLCAAIVPNVVAVHAKTIRLEGKSAWSVQ